VAEVNNVELDPPVELVENTTTAHVWTLTIFVSRVTLPPNANAPPFNTAAVSSVTEAAARILPWNALSVPKVAEDPTCQNTLQANAPPVSTIPEPVAVIKELPIWKYQASLDEPVPARAKTPVRAAELLKLYVPGGKVLPPRLPVKGIAPPRVTSILYAVWASLRAVVAWALVNSVPV
jgi:hypothetical protein